MEVFNQTVWMTVVGMVALTRWAGGRGKIALLKAEPSKAIPADERVEELERAAAIAVAVALAQAARRAGPTYAWHTARPEEEPSPWQAYARGQQLEQAKTHQTLRW